MNTTSIMDLCFLCTKDYNCVAVDNKIVFQVEYLLPEITIFKLGLPLRICSDCDGALGDFSKFKHSSLESSRRLEARIKEAQGPPLHTGSPPVVDDNETSDAKPEKIEEIFIKEEPMEQTSLDTNIQPHTHRVLPNSTTQLQSVSAEPQNQLYKDVASQNIQLDADTNSDNAEHIFIKEEPLQETSRDKEFYNDIIQDPLKEECNTKVWAGSSGDSTEETVEETDRNSIKNIQIINLPEYLCNICNSRFLKQSSLTYHMKKVHLRKKDLPCSICKKLFNHKYDLNRHMKLHNKIKNFNCPVCKTKFSDQRNLKQHLNLHVEEKDFHCETCNETFTLETYLKNHVTHRDSQVEESLKCNICNKLFARKRNLDDHMKIHAGVKDFHCNTCNKSFAQKHYFLNHMKIHSEVFEHHCDICSKSFAHKNHLVKHMKIHSGLKDFQCNICNKSFAEKSNLNLHMKIHSEVKDFRCDICSKMFRYKSNLVDHMKIHSGVKEFRCDICNKSFTHKSNLVAHVKKMHSE